MDEEVMTSPNPDPYSPLVYPDDLTSTSPEPDLNSPLAYPDDLTSTSPEPDLNSPLAYPDDFRSPSPEPDLNSPLAYPDDFTSTSPELDLSSLLAYPEDSSSPSLKPSECPSPQPKLEPESPLPQFEYLATDTEVSSQQKFTAEDAHAQPGSVEWNASFLQGVRHLATGLMKDGSH
ncbi:hypothetical protein GYMLUDRAFT_60690 [Collybiopsis luxurians FD-317 M1]|uniref:Uncharacterized protein n=1 Tax=Collybiopsis luxurians FD-317 M1 TaxID=944289 RepID=A0A0D0CRT3_9AGAR|nr:hypothetical protein GYMLUDRAFT_60690 [Collybiopsis luxurians FD-317 M1]